MTDRLLIVRTTALTVAELNEMKRDDHVREIRQATDYLILVVTPEFKTSLEILDVDHVFRVLIDGRVRIESDGEEGEGLRGQSLHTSAVIQLVPDSPKE